MSEKPKYMLEAALMQIAQEDTGDLLTRQQVVLGFATMADLYLNKGDYAGAKLCLRLGEKVLRGQTS